MPRVAQVLCRVLRLLKIKVDNTS